MPHPLTSSLPICTGQMARLPSGLRLNDASLRGQVEVQHILAGLDGDFFFRLHMVFRWQSFFGFVGFLAGIRILDLLAGRFVPMKTDGLVAKHRPQFLAELELTLHDPSACHLAFGVRRHERDVAVAEGLSVERDLAGDGRALWTGIRLTTAPDRGQQTKQRSPTSPSS